MYLHERERDKHWLIPPSIMTTKYCVNMLINKLGVCWTKPNQKGHILRWSWTAVIFALHFMFDSFHCSDSGWREFAEKSANSMQTTGELHNLLLAKGVTGFLCGIPLCDQLHLAIANWLWHTHFSIVTDGYRCVTRHALGRHERGFSIWFQSTFSRHLRLAEECNFFCSNRWLPTGLLACVTMFL